MEPEGTLKQIGSAQSQADAKINATPTIIISNGWTSSSRSSVGSGPNSDLRALMRGEIKQILKPEE
jgi:hypothetical protein